jgi:hypothetical protein
MVGEHSKFYNNPDYPEFSWKAGNARYCTVSAGPGGTGGKFLVTELNRLDDAPRSDVQYSVVVHPPKGESNDKFIQQLLKGDAHYHDHYNSDKVKYDKDPDGHCNFNSNSFTSGLLNAILFGKTPQEPPLAVGWDHPLSSIYFRISDFLHKG